jgi:signal transduction histidine kinase/CheY-like chemotaxis protein
MGREQILSQIVRSPRLPSPPAIALQVLNLVNQPTCDLRELAKVLFCDPGLCGRVLGIVNSSLYATGQKVTSVERALQVLGLKRVRTLVLGLALPGMRCKSTPDAWVTSFWKRSIAHSIIVRELSIRLRRPDPETDMVAGLLCDLGCLLLHATFPEDYAIVRQRLGGAHGNRLCELELEIIGVEHAEVGAAVLSDWGLPRDVTDAIRQHHEQAPTLADESQRNRATLLCFASRLAQLADGPVPAQELVEIAAIARNHCAMDGAQLGRFLEGLPPKISEFAWLLEIEVARSDNFHQLHSNVIESLTRCAVELSLDNLRTHEEKSLVEEGLKRAEAVLQKQEEHLRQASKMEAIGRLAGGIAHDFNNLLTIINGCSQVLMGTMRETDKNYQLIREINKAGDRAAALTRQLLAFSRKQVLQPQVLDINALLADMESLLQRLIGSQITLSLSRGSGRLHVKADPGQLEQVIMNLVVNARDAIPLKGRIEIETSGHRSEPGLALDDSATSTGPYVLITVRDTGVGMNQATLDHLFEPFFTTKEFGKGTGLGLAVVHGIVKQSGGTIRVASKVGNGTTFRIRFPQVHDDVTVHGKEAAAKPLPPSNRTVILAEDEDAVRGLARLALEQCGFRTLEARDGVEAMRISNDFVDSIDLLVTDVVMPQMSGMELARQMSARRPKMKIVYTSGYTDEAMLRGDASAPGSALGPGSAFFLQKPYTPRDLAAKVNSALA